MKKTVQGSDSKEQEYDAKIMFMDARGLDDTEDVCVGIHAQIFVWVIGEGNGSESRGMWFSMFHAFDSRCILCIQTYILFKFKLDF